MIKRESYQKLLNELMKDGKMAFITGPRQSGKTTLAKVYSEKFPNKIYFNWDSYADKKTLASDPNFFEKIDRKDSSKPLVILDEIHKYKKWKNYLKGAYDSFSSDYTFIVTGSGRLDVFSRVGEALTGRYFQMNLFPFTIGELAKKRKKLKDFISSPLKDFNLNPRKETSDIWKNLFNFGGFPEPFVKGRKTFLSRWSDSYATQIIRDDIRTLYDLKNIDSLEMLFALIPSKAGSPFSINNIAQDLQTSFDTVKNWLEILDSFYIIFTVSTWTKKISRSILKEKKLYLFNYTELDNEAIRFENMAALELYKAVKFWNNFGYGKFNLHYLRNKEKEEVDFLLTNNDKPFLLIETKYNDINISKSLFTYQNILNIPAVQLINTDNIHRTIKNGNNYAILVTAHEWFSSLPLE